MIPSQSIPNVSISAAASQHVIPDQDLHLPKLDLSGASSAEAKPTYNDDDDDFYILYASSYSPHGTLKKETIEKLSKDHPGIFDGLHEPDELFEADPVKYQPLARLIHETPNLETILDADEGRGDGDPCWTTEKIPYGIHKYGFYRIEEDYEDMQWVRIDLRGYEEMKKNKLFFSQLRDFVSDPGMSNDDKVSNLLQIFSTVEEDGDDVSVDQVRSNFDLLFKDASNKAQQRAIEAGLKP